MQGKKLLLPAAFEDLVLNGAFDEIFKFKGFDLRTGKVLHHPHRGFVVQVTGDSPATLWTRNALERSGYNVTTEQCDVRVTLIEGEGAQKWRVKKNETVEETSSLENLLDFLNKRLQ